MVPNGLGLDDATALLHDGRTALGLLDATGVEPGDWVLITAAAGGLGNLVIQLARAVGARVVAAARGTNKLQLTQHMGAEVTIGRFSILLAA